MSFRLLFPAGFIGLALTRRRWGIGSLTVRENGNVKSIVAYGPIQIIFHIHIPFSRTARLLISHLRRVKCQSDEACSKQQAKAQTQGKINFWLWIKWKSLQIEIYQSDEPLQGSSLLDYLFMYRKPGWLWTDFHYFHKYLHNDEFNSGFPIGIS